MSSFHNDIPVLKRTLDEIDRVATNVREQCGYGPNDILDPSVVMKKRRIDLVSRSDKEMGSAVALASSGKQFNRIFAREGFLAALRRNSEVARSQIGHEIGHLEMHRGQEMKPLLVGGNGSARFIREDESSEAQAWKFSRALYLHRDSVSWSRSDSEIADTHRLPVDEVRVRRTEVRSLQALGRPKKDLSHLVASAVRSLDVGSAGQWRTLWINLERLDGYDPSKVRLCRGYLVEWDNYGIPNPPSQTGWFVRDGRIVPYLCQE